MKKQEDFENTLEEQISEHKAIKEELLSPPETKKYIVEIPA